MSLYWRVGALIFLTILLFSSSSFLTFVICFPSSLHPPSLTLSIYCFYYLFAHPLLSFRFHLFVKFVSLPFLLTISIISDLLHFRFFTVTGALHRSETAFPDKWRNIVYLSPCFNDSKLYHNTQYFLFVSFFKK